MIRHFLSRAELIACCREHGVVVKLNGLRPSLASAVLYLIGRRKEVRMVRTRPTGVLFQGVGLKAP